MKVIKNPETKQWWCPVCRNWFDDDVGCDCESHESFKISRTREKGLYVERRTIER